MAKAKQQSNTVTVPAYKLKQLSNGSYVVLDGDDNSVTQEYGHETSAYAAIGRLVAKAGETEPEEEE